MEPRNRHSLYRFMMALGIAIPGLIGILSIQVRAAASEANSMSSDLQLQATSTPTATLQTIPSVPSQTSTSAPEIDFLTPSGVLSSSLYAFIQPPLGSVPQPYVILTAFSSVPRTFSGTIKGFVNSQEFICTHSPCIIHLQSSSRLVFAASSDSGETSEMVIASVSLRQVSDGYVVTIDSVSQFQTFSDFCSNAWDISDQANVTWNDFVQFPYEIHTKKTLHTLATQLLVNGIVNASDCPSGGLSIGLNWPSACGLERASKTMIEWQNQFDDHIWLASKNQGIPPKILKSIVEIESQFWPSNGRFYVDEYGLGQINQLGVDVLLRKDSTLFQSVCRSVLSDCSRPYLSLEPQQQAMIRGAVVGLADASCADCAYGIDLNKAKESVSLIAKLLKANCQQVDYILSLAARPDPDADAATAAAAVATLEKLQRQVAKGEPTLAAAAAATLAAGGGQVTTTSYEDMWRFTFLSYHSGLSCFQDAANATRKAHEAFTWENLKERLRCKGARDYVDGLMNNLESFDLYLSEPNPVSSVMVEPTFIPTRTPVSTPTLFISSATVRVQVFMDRNGNHSPDEGEWIDAMTVLLETSTNEQITQRTKNGIAIFDMSGYTPGTGINVSLPGLYRNERFDLPQQGEVTVTFMFEAPPLPTRIP